MINKGPFVLGGWTDQELCTTMTSTGPNPLPGITKPFFSFYQTDSIRLLPFLWDTLGRRSASAHCGQSWDLDAILFWASKAFVGSRDIFEGKQHPQSEQNEAEDKMWLSGSCVTLCLNEICMSSPPESRPLVVLCSERHSALCFSRRVLVKWRAEGGVQFPGWKQNITWQQLCDGLQLEPWGTCFELWFPWSSVWLKAQVLMHVLWWLLMPNTAARSHDITFYPGHQVTHTCLFVLLKLMSCKRRLPKILG